jgi:hypothetical protein
MMQSWRMMFDHQRIPNLEAVKKNIIRERKNSRGNLKMNLPSIGRWNYMRKYFQPACYTRIKYQP